jgi:capsular polysaccharide export protein
MTDHAAIHRRFCAHLAAIDGATAPTRDIRQHVLSLRSRKVGFGLITPTLDKRFGANLRRLFPNARAVDAADFPESEVFFATGTQFPDPEHSHKGGARLFARLPEGREVIFFEPAFLATTYTWAQGFRDDDPAKACLGYVYDDLAYYFMADRTNRLTEWLNGDTELTEVQTARARHLIERIVTKRISKYNDQPLRAPTMTEGYPHRVLVVDQAYADASTVHGKVGDAEFERMLIAALTENPEAEVLVKTHPDTTTGGAGRTGFYTHLESTGRVRVLKDPVNPFALFEHVDKVYVGTSQMGLEALFAGKKVVCFGAPFYAGWGLTDDRQKTPHRHRKRRLEDLFHAFYVWYSIFHVPGCPVPSTVEDALDFIEAHRPVALPVTQAEAETPPKVSVIIPVHGVAAFLDQCLDSVQRQSLREIEIIPVNDASPDGSQAIIDRRAADDSRIRPIVLRDNVGQGFARNAGIAAARGDYVWFLDGDDWLENRDLLRDVCDVAIAEGSDMVRAKKAYEALCDEAGNVTGQRPDPTEAYFNRSIARTTFADTPDLLHSRHHWTWLYRRAFLTENDVRFATAQWEERAFLVKALVRAGTISLTTTPGPAYRIRSGSTARRHKTTHDFAQMLTNFTRSAEALIQAGGAGRADPLRHHLAYTATQFVHHMFVGPAWRHLRDRPEGAAFLRDARALLIRCDMRPGDVVNDAPNLPETLIEAAAFPLLVAAIRAGRVDLIDLAIDARPVPQDVVYATALATPASPDDADLQAALNTYARNDRIRRIAPLRPKPRMKPRIIVHIGTTKTGTTFLQNLMEQNRPALLRAGVWYPEVGLFWQAKRPHKQAGHSEFTPAAVHGRSGLRDHIEAGLAHMGGRVHTIVLSSEAFFLQDRAHEIASYFDGCNVEMVVYLRRQDEWANAQYCEFVAGGAIGRVDAPLGDWLAEPKTRARLDYRRVIAAWQAHIGRGNIHVRVYEPGQMAGGDLVSDFAATTGLEVLTDLPRPDRDASNGARLAGPHVELIRSYNARPFPDRAAYFRFIEEVTESVATYRAKRGLPMPKPWVMPMDVMTEVMAAASEGNAEIARDYLGRDDGLLFHDPPRMPDDTALTVDELEIAAACYARHAPPSAGRVGGEPAPLDTASYGLFGWRFWLMTPIVALAYARIASAEDLADFLRTPAQHTHRHWRASHPRLTRWLYPDPPRPLADRVRAALGRIARRVRLGDTGGMKRPDPAKTAARQTATLNRGGAL